MSVEAKVAQTAVKVATQTAGQNGQVQLPGSGQSPFMDILQQHEVKMSAENADIMQTLGYNPQSHPADNAVSAGHLDIQVGRVESMQSVQSTDKVANMLTQINRDGLQMQRIMEMMTSGGNFSNKELIAVQAMVHQVALEVQIGVQAMDAAKNSIQTLVQRSVSG